MTKRHVLALMAIATVALAIPAGARAGTGSDCSYVSGGAGTQTVVVYTTGGSVSGSLVGVCVDDGPGGTVEAGSQLPSGGTGTYVVLDGDAGNPDPVDGYVGLSSYETGDKDPTCDESDGGTGSNSGGCVGVRGIVPYTALPGFVPTPICGNESGSSWTDAARDGCQIP